MKESNYFLDDFFQRLRRRRLVKITFSILKWTFFTLLFLLIACWVLLQNKRVQNWAIHQTTTYLSEELNTTVDVDSISIELFDKLVLEGVFIQDQSGDTLLYSQKLKSNLSANLLGIIQGRLDVDELYLENTQINLLRDSSQQDHNLQFIIDYLASRQKPKKKKKKKKDSQPFLLNVGWIHLNNVHFRKVDIPKGEILDVWIPKGNIGMDSINLVDNRFVVGTLDIRKPVVKLDKIEKKPLPKTVKKQLVSIKETPEVEADSTRNPLWLSVVRLALSDGQFHFHNYRKSPKRSGPDDAIDFDHLDLQEITISGNELSFDEQVVRGGLEHLALKTKSGFVLEELAADEMSVSNRRIELFGMNLQTPNSQIQDTLVFKSNIHQDLILKSIKIFKRAVLKN
ncbi:MAG: hypothetical protein AAFP19_26035, partial [Bacteroidota bacterium]